MNDLAMDKKRVCYFRGSFLNAYETQYLEPLRAEFDLSVAYTKSHRFDVADIPIPSTPISCLDYLNGLVPRRLGGRALPNPLKFLGFDEVIWGVDRLTKDVDLMHVQEQTFYSTWQIAKYKKKGGYKLLTVQCEVTPYWYVRRPAIVRRAAFVRQETDLFIARSERAKMALLAEGVLPEKVRVIGHGVDLSRFHPGERDKELCDRLNVDPSRFVILFVGHLLWTKGIFALAHAAKLLLNDPNVRRLDPLFLLVGDGDERAQLQNRLRLLGIRDHFILAGRQSYDHLPAIHRLADIFVLPSISTQYILEQFGIVLIESMATGKPVISTYCGAIDEVIGDAGVLVQPNDYFRLYEALRDLCKSEGLRQELRGRALARVNAHFTHNIISSKIASAYGEVLAK